MAEADPRTNTVPSENAVSSHVTLDGPKATARDKSPEHQYKPTPGDSNNATPGSDAPTGPVNIPVKGAADASDDGVTPETRAKATGQGRADASGSQPQ